MDNEDIVIQDTIKRIIRLKERVDKLEKRVQEKHALKLEPASSSCSDNQSSNNKEHVSLVLRKIKARAEDDHVLISIQCLKMNGSTAKIASEIERLGLSTLTLSVVPFGESILNLTFFTQMEDGFNMTMTDLVTNLQEAL
ncbi:transcription factor bHLH18-like [Impatiens glandulifera]|uniref:transcription factor bHLH18-like n=1 Tax=Impatiens glandulifera TaxID=253017 RepID=UPI001FB120BC|nr:transcription factor bHLH18-like [Impatiens glandulifera]